MARPTNDIGGDRPRTRACADCDPQPGWPSAVWRCALVGAILALAATPAAAQPGRKPQPGGSTGTPGRDAKDAKPPAGGDVETPNPNKGKPKVFDFTGLDISGRLRTPQLLYFLDRANEELERASLERRSFIPEMVRSVDEGNL
jgi:hypothetical protein